jgi:hypothetical protein
MDSTPSINLPDEIASTTTTTTTPNQVNVSIMNVGMSQQQQQQQPSLTPEQEQERQLKDKYPNPQRPGGSAFIQKILNRGNKKYFDSGDYNMAKSKSKATNLKGSNSLGMPTNTTTTPAITTTNMDEHTPAIVIEAQSPLSPASSTAANLVDTNNQMTSTTNLTSPHINPNPNINSIVLTPTHNNNNNNNNNSSNYQHHQTSPLSSNINIVNNNNHHHNATSPALTPNPNLLNSLNQLPHPTMSTSVSSQSINMLSASLSSEKIANIHINTNANLLDTDEIGHGIPTPECLPQSRKHSIVQSKLATPRLSSS